MSTGAGHRVGVARLRAKADYRDSGALDDAVTRACSGERTNGVQAVVPAGGSVLVKPNWVLDQNLGGAGMECMVTHPEFILAVLRQLAPLRLGRVIVADAPIQSCKFHVLVPAGFRGQCEAAVGAPVEIIDLRRVAITGPGIDSIRATERPDERYVLFDLGVDSRLEPITGRHSPFRVTNYDPRRMSEAHARGRHRYSIAKEAFEVDAVISLPKLKTHRKVGLTGALKNLVGLVGSKESLPHHRIGGTALGGDCYPGLAPVKRIAEAALDAANRRIGGSGYPRAMRLFARLQNLQSRFGDREISGGWQGNDTAWRMVLDINAAVVYGTIASRLAATPQRRIYTITDGIIAGQGEGPLAPEPCSLGLVTASASPAHADWIHARLMGFDPAVIPLVMEALRAEVPFPLTDGSEPAATLDGAPVSLDDLSDLVGRRFSAPGLWPVLEADHSGSPRTDRCGDPRRAP